MRTRMEERGGGITDVSRVAWEEGWVTGAVMYIAATSGVTVVYLAVTPASSFRTGGVHICPHRCPGLCWDRRVGNDVAVIYLLAIPRVTPRYPTASLAATARYLVPTAAVTARNRTVAEGGAENYPTATWR